MAKLLWNLVRHLEEIPLKDATLPKKHVKHKTAGISLGKESDEIVSIKIPLQLYFNGVNITQ